MNTIRIKHWHRHYRVREPHVAAWERLASGAVLVAFDEAMTKTVPDDGEVILLRKVALKFTTTKPNGSDLDLAEQWGRAMATAVQEAIHRNDPANVRRFADVEEHVVSYLEALVNEQNADAWYFARLRGIESTACTVDSGNRGQFDTLLEHFLEHWPEILSRLCQRGRAMPVLRRLSFRMQRRLWSVGVRGIDPNRDRGSERPLFQAALQILARLRGIENGVEDCEAAFQAFSSRPQPFTDWSDTTHLAEGVFAAVRFLVDRFSSFPAVSTGNSVTVSDRIWIAIQPFDWLDRKWLHDRLISYLTRIPHSATSRSKVTSPITRIHAVWNQVWTDIEPHFYSCWDPTNPASEPNCLLALSLMVEKHAAWVHDPAIGLFIERRLADIASKRASGSVESIHSSTTTSAPGEVSTATDKLTQATRTIDVRGPDAEQLPRVQQLVVANQQLTTSGRTVFPTNYAGVFLLARGIHDLKIPSLARQSNFPSAVPWAASELLMRLASQWCQRDRPAEVDVGLLEFSRLAGAAEWNDLMMPGGQIDEAATYVFQSRLADSLIGLRTWSETSELHIKFTENSTEKWLYGGNVTGQVFPWCRRVFRTEDFANTIDVWKIQLSEWSNEPVAVAFDESVSLLGGTTSFAAGLPSVLENSEALTDVKDAGQRLSEQTIQATASSVLRHCARSIRGFATSGEEFLLQQFIRRAGTIHKSEGRIDITMEGRPLDVALEASGMLEPLDFFTASGLTRINFHTE